MSRSRSVSLVAALFVTLAGSVLLAQPSKQADSVRSVSLAEIDGEWAVCASTGGIAVLHPASNGVALYAGIAAGTSLEAPKRRPVGAQPVSIVHKPVKDGGYFVVACKGDRTIHVLDEKTLEPVKVFRLSAGAPRYLSAASDPVSPIVYFATTRGDSTQITGTIGRLDLSAMKLDGPMEMYAHDEQEVTASADGSIFYLRRVNLTPAGFEAWTTLPPATEKRPSRAIPVFSAHDEKPATFRMRRGSASRRAGCSSAPTSRRRSPSSLPRPSDFCGRSR